MARTTDDPKNACDTEANGFAPEECQACKQYTLKRDGFMLACDTCGHKQISKHALDDVDIGSDLTVGTPISPEEQLRRDILDDAL